MPGPDKPRREDETPTTDPVAGETPSKAELDLRYLTEEPAESSRVDLQEIPHHSPQWAKITWPVAKILLGLIASIMLVPFLIIVSTSDVARIDHTLDWAKTVLPPAVGFGGAVVGYYFGTRGGQQAPASDD